MSPSVNFLSFKIWRDFYTPVPAEGVRPASSINSA
ncbi:hypothetical protein NHJ13051_000643 [Beauveria bassiana]